MRIQRKKKRVDRDQKATPPLSQELFHPSSTSVDSSTQLQRSTKQSFNFADVAISRPPNPVNSTIQTKMEVGKANDKYEQEADRVASGVVQSIHQPQSPVTTNIQTQKDIEYTQSDNSQEIDNKQLQSSITIRSSMVNRAIQNQEQVNQSKNSPFAIHENPLNRHRIVQRTDIKPEQLAVPIDSIQRNSSSSASGENSVSSEFEQQLNQAKTGGQPLAPQIQSKMGNAIGANFSRVRVHTDHRSDQLNRSIQAKAFTTKNHIFFKKDEYNPNSRGGQELIAHELTHTVQQGASPQILQAKADTTIGNAPQLQHKLKRSQSDNYIQCFRIGERPFKQGYDQVIQHPDWHKEARAYEQRLGGYCANRGQAKSAATNTLGKMRDVMERYFGENAQEEISESFFKDDKTSAGQIGKPETREQLNEAVDYLFSGRSNLREKMTAIYNAAYYGAGFGTDPSRIPVSFKAILQDIVLNQQFEQAKELNLDEKDLRSKSGFLRGSTRKRIFDMIKKVMPDKAYNYNEDIFSLGNLNYQSDQWFKDSVEIGTSQAPKSSRSELEHHVGSEKKTPRDYREMGVPLSERELAFSDEAIMMKDEHLDSSQVRLHQDGYPIIEGMLNDYFQNAQRKYKEGYTHFVLKDEQRGTVEEVKVYFETGESGYDSRTIKDANYQVYILNPRTHDLDEGVQGPELPLNWLEGGAYYKLDPNAGWFKKIHDRLGMPVVAGTSGTTTRMMKVFQWLNVSGTNWADYRTALMGWMLTSWDHSLYEMLRGSEAAGFRGRNDTTDDVIDMYQNVAPFTTEELRINVGKLGMFPHEYIYEQMTSETDPDKPQLINPGPVYKEEAKQKRWILEVIADGQLDQKINEFKHKGQELKQERSQKQSQIDNIQQELDSGDQRIKNINQQIEFLELEKKALELSKYSGMFTKTSQEQPPEDDSQTDGQIKEIEDAIAKLHNQIQATKKYQIRLQTQKTQLEEENKNLLKKLQEQVRNERLLEGRGKRTANRLERAGIGARDMLNNTSIAHMTSIVNYTGGTHHYLNDVLTLPKPLAQKRIKSKLTNTAKSLLYGKLFALLTGLVNKVQEIQNQKEAELNNVASVGHFWTTNTKKQVLRTDIKAIQNLKAQLIKQRNNYQKNKRKALSKLKGGYGEAGQYGVVMEKMAGKVFTGEKEKIEAQIENVTSGRNNTSIVNTQLTIPEYFAQVKTIAAQAYDELILHVNMTVEGLQSLPAVSGKKVYRGDWKSKNTSFTYRKGLFNPATISFNSLTSTSYDLNTAKNFMKTHGVGTEKVLVEIELTGKGGKDISYLSLSEGEEEVLLMPGTTCQYVSSRNENKYKVMTYREI